MSAKTSTSSAKTGTTKADITAKNRADTAKNRADTAKNKADTAKNVVLISTYELGRQPFGLASPAAWLKEEGAGVRCFDLAVEKLDKEVVAGADLIGFYVPMHTATRLAARFFEQVKAINPRAHYCFYGLYAPVNEEYLRQLGADTVLGGEFEEGLVSVLRRIAAGDRKSVV